MNIFRQFTGSTPVKKVLLYTKGFFRVSSPLLVLGAIEVVGVMFASERRWRSGRTRIVDSPLWDGYTQEQVENIIESRGKFVSAFKELCEMKPGAAKDESIAQLFSEKCVYEDPMIRLVGRKEIMSIFNHLPTHLAKSEFKRFEPTHYKDKIVINCLRHSSQLHYGEQFELPPLNSNIIIQVTHNDDSEQPQMTSILDEWNYVTLYHPETHNVYVFVGSVARLLRRLSYYYVKPDKTALNPFILFDLRAKLVRIFKDTYRNISEGQLNNNDKKLKKYNESGGIIFNAGITEETK